MIENSGEIPFLAYEEGSVKIKAIKPEVLIKALEALRRISLESGNLMDIRDRFICGFLFWTGVRESELLLTKRNMIDLKERLYTVPSVKKKRVRREEYTKKAWHELARHNPKLITIPLTHVPDVEIDFWNEYFEIFGIEWNEYILPAEKVIFSRRGKGEKLPVLTERSIRYIVKRRLSPLCRTDVHPHMLRHSLGFLLASMNFSDRKIAEILRHDDTTVTSLYARMGAIFLRDDLKLVKQEVEDFLSTLFD